jgi:hypothetical protein
MKHQYFGDVNDYRKYGLLRGLSANGAIQTGVCWMLTRADGRSDGQLLTYLNNADGFRAFAPDLFDFLCHCVRTRKSRRTALIEAAGCLPSTIFFSKFLPDDMLQRKAYLAQMLQKFARVDLIFFDPDNGFEINSKPIGRKGASKYLYWSELQQAYEAGHSVLVYQHFTREGRTNLIQRIASTVMERTRTDFVFSFRTPRVVFFLVSQPQHIQHFATQAKAISREWGDRQMAVRQHRRYQAEVGKKRSQLNGT